MKKMAKRLEAEAGSALIPGATYRLQFNRDFTFEDAIKTAGYLRELGITHLYASPIFQAGPQSTHGYDICGFDQFSPTLGGSDGFDRLSTRLRELSLGLVLDMVPNHMGNHLSNCWWVDLLTHGRDSKFAKFFDIDWRPSNSNLVDQVLLPTLGEHYGKTLESAQLKLVFNDGVFGIAYHDRRFPLAPRCYPDLLEEITALMPDNSDQVQPLIEDLRRSPAIADPQELSDIQEQLKKLTLNHPAFAAAVNAVLANYNGRAGLPRSFDKLHGLLQRQHYRLAWWRVGSEEINYRRFFDVTELVSLRMELFDVFQASHKLVLDLLAEGRVHGLRIDHPDGLRDPREYFLRLQAGFLKTRLTADSNPGDQDLDQAISDRLADQLHPLERELARQPIAHGLWHTAEATRSDPLVEKAPAPNWPLYVVAEKILSGDETLRLDWPVHGTTGYDFLNYTNGLFVNRASERAFHQIYTDFTGNSLDFKTSVYLGKKRILTRSLISELKSLTHQLKRVAAMSRWSLDFTFSQLETALIEVIANFPVYRTYITENTIELAPVERSWVELAIEQAQNRKPSVDPEVFNFLQELLCLRFPPDMDGDAIEQCRAFILRFQQLTGPATAKGVEDTAFYNYNQLVTLNEVGGEPSRFGVSVPEFHEYNLHKAEKWPHSMLATATHDTKRGEDVRARINTLSEMPEDWRRSVQRWSRMNANKKTFVNDSPAPHPNDEYLLYQSLIGAWPMPNASGQIVTAPTGGFQDRIAAYMLKAIKESKSHTSWTEPNAAYEEATSAFVKRTLDRDVSHSFLDDFASFQRNTSFFGVFNSLAQVVLKLAAPGVPDFYQGTELWDFSLVDPDNRRPVDYELRRRWLGELREEFKNCSFRPHSFLKKLLDEAPTGQIKLFTIERALACRQRHAPLFQSGNYIPVAASGPKKEHICAFARTHGDASLLTLVPRMVASLMGNRLSTPLGPDAWLDTILICPTQVPPGKYRDVFTNQEFTLSPSQPSRDLLISRLLGLFPVAMLERLP
jgi:(1->4)-alpha-D-glucan 1-alpha-D-glucosylmutase